jgi:hypothetical protein
MLTCGRLEYNLNKVSSPNDVGHTREDFVRWCLRDLFNKPFEKVRPDWLVNPKTGRHLELDCYNDELKLAVEINGEQHYVFPNTFHKTEAEFLDQQERDKIKKQKCEDSGITFLEVPYTIPKNQIREYINKNLIRVYNI